MTVLTLSVINNTSNDTITAAIRLFRFESTTISFKKKQNYYYYSTRIVQILNMATKNMVMETAQHDVVSISSWERDS